LFPVWSNLLEEIQHNHNGPSVFAYPIQRIDLKFSDAYWQPFIHLLPKTAIKAILPDKNKHHAKPPPMAASTCRTPDLNTILYAQSPK
jgi:hypothetical protein